MNPFAEPILITRPLLPSLPNLMTRIEEIWDSKWITNNGGQLKDLETELKDYLKVDYLSLFNNGTSALLLGLKALDLTGEVITTPFTFPATVQALDWNGLTPVFCDINPITLTIDPTKIEALITEKTSAILAVHVFGNPCDVEEIQRIANKHQLKVIYDGAHAFGTHIKGVPIGRFGDMTMYSFHATKLFNTIEGGGLVFANPMHIEKLNLLKNFGLTSTGEVALSGLNAKMNELQAALGLEVLKLIGSERERREKIAKTYQTHLKDIPGIRVLTLLERDSSSYQYFVIEIDEEKYGHSRDWVHEQLKDSNIFTRKYFYPLCSDFEWYSHIESASPNNLVVAQKAVHNVLAMPYYGELALESVEKICGILQQLHTDVVRLEQYN